MAKLFANSGDPDKTPHSAASVLGLHFLPNTLLGVCKLQSVKELDIHVLVYFRHFSEEDDKRLTSCLVSCASNCFSTGFYS